jgi:hypothetical protein
MGESKQRGGSWIGTWKGKIINASVLIATVVAAFLFVSLSITWYLAYVDSTKLRAQRGDTVDFVYIGMYDSNGTVFDSGTIPDTVIGSNSLLDYFDKQLVGMEPGVGKTFVIPAAENEYTTGPPVGHDLRFGVTITKLSRNGTVLYPVSAP